MKPALAAAAALFVLLGSTAVAHRLDEYLQATIISLDSGSVRFEVRLSPGVSVFPVVFAEIDRDADGVISAAEQRAYAERVLRDLSFTADGERVTPRLVSAKFPPVDEMKEGSGEIQLEFDSKLRNTGVNRSLTFENRHLTPISAYLVNSLVPRDPGIRITAQDRNSSQSVYRLNYVVASAGSDWSVWACLAGFAVLLCARIAYKKPRHQGARYHASRFVMLTRK